MYVCMYVCMYNELDKACFAHDADSKYLGERTNSDNMLKDKTHGIAIILSTMDIKED